MTCSNNYRSFTSIFLLFFVAHLSASSQGQKIPTYYIDSDIEVLSLTDTISYFVDETTSLSKTEIEQQAFIRTSEVPLLKPRVNFWFRFKLTNLDSISISFYLCEGHQEKRTYIIDNVETEYGNREIHGEKTDRGCASMKINPRSTKELYILHRNLQDTKIATELELRSSKLKNLFKLFKTSNHDVTAKFTNSVLAFMCIISFVFFIAFKEKFIGYYTLYIFCFFLFYSRRRAAEFLLPFDHHIEVNLTYLIFPSYLLFVKYLLDTPKFNHRLNRIINFIVPVSLAFLFITLLLQIFHGIQSSFLMFNIYRAFMFFGIIIVIFMLLKYNRNKISIIICLGNLFVVIPIFSTFLAHLFNFSHVKNAGYIFKKLSTPWNFDYYMMHARVGVTIEIIFFSIAIAIYLKQKVQIASKIQTTQSQIIVNENKLNREEKTNDFSIQLTKYILHRKQESIKLDDLVKQFGMGRTKLIETIKVETGKTPNKFIRHIKLASAKKDLMTTDKSIKEIAYEYGYSTPSYFSREFKAEFNLSPNKVRAELDNLK